MSAFAVLLAEYKCPMARPVQAGAKVATGKISRITLPNHSGYILVQWERGVPGFNDYLAKARSLKSATRSPGWAPNYNGWLFAVQFTQDVLAAFSGFEVAPEVNGGTVPQAKVSYAPGQIAISGQNVFVTWANNPAKFGTFLAIARNLRADHGGQFVKAAGGWAYPKRAAAAVVQAFESHGFECDAEVAALTGKANAAPTTDEDALLAAADDLFGSEDL